MKVLSCQLENFASYKQLDFTFNDQGAVLIQGATGSGKSTLCDAIPWALFGRTAKGGAVDEVLSWNGGTTKATVWLNGLTISRSRGQKAKDNDLSFWPDDGAVTRGKDLQDTQKMINNLIQVDFDLYMIGAYFNEFSPTAQFFTTTAKSRRSMCEQIVDLSLAKTLQQNSSAMQKELAKEAATSESHIVALKSGLQILNKMAAAENTKASDWDTNKKLRLEKVEFNALRFEDNRAKRITQLIETSAKKAKSPVCSECGAPKMATAHKHYDNSSEIQRIENEENPYIIQLQEMQLEANPHNGAAKDYSQETEASEELIKEEATTLVHFKQQLSDIETLTDIVADFRGALISNTISDLEQQTNLLLSKHFDGEFRISLSIPDADKLDVSIQKDGNICSYSQLSKGQRCMLKLCFGTSIMRCVSNHHGIQFSQIFLDESLEGLDENLKVKAYGLIQAMSLEYDSVFVVEHSPALKEMFTNQYHVELVNGESKIEKST